MPRPVFSFRRFVGHRKKVEVLRRQLIGAKIRGEPFPHTMFSGPSGVGKTLLTECLAEEYGTRCHAMYGHAKIDDLVAVYRSIGECDFLFVDEAHNLKPKSQELLYQMIDHGRLTVTEPSPPTAGSAPQRTAERIERRVTIVIASDQPGKLLNALEKRMQLHVALGFYTERELRDIIDRLAANMNLRTSAQAANHLARVSCGLPRRARHHLENLRRHFPDEDVAELSIGHVREYLADFGIDDLGLGQVERNYLRFLRDSNRASLDSLASHLGYDTDFIRRQIEPVLKRAGLSMIGSGGRMLTSKGRALAEELHPLDDLDDCSTTPTK